MGAKKRTRVLAGVLLIAVTLALRDRQDRESFFRFIQNPPLATGSAAISPLQGKPETGGHPETSSQQRRIGEAVASLPRWPPAARVGEESLVSMRTPEPPYASRPKAPAGAKRQTASPALSSGSKYRQPKARENPPARGFSGEPRFSGSAAPSIRGAANPREGVHGRAPDPAAAEEAVGKARPRPSPATGAPSHGPAPESAAWRIFFNPSPEKNSGMRRGQLPAAGAYERLRRLKPPSFSRSLGAKPLRPPEASLAPPSGNPWAGPLPRHLEDGTPIFPYGLSLDEAEAVEPPQLKKLGAHHGKVHWHRNDSGHYLHHGDLWGSWSRGHWSWLERQDSRWWLWANASAGALAWQQGHWWLREGERWFLLHQGTPWGYQALINRWGQGGYERPDGSQLLYSADGRRVAVIVSGEGAALYDALSGEALGYWPDSELPARFKMPLGIIK
ncbi:MAG: hypothetical protein HY921_01535 [Elusimicrobia bacterium]|nr:hypothetical protein [Elusimicrobiota bacterium]